MFLTKKGPSVQDEQYQTMQKYQAFDAAERTLFSTHEWAHLKQCQFNMAHQQVIAKQKEFTRPTYYQTYVRTFHIHIPLHMYSYIVSSYWSKATTGRFQEFPQALYYFIIGTTLADVRTRMIWIITDHEINNFGA